MGRWFEWRPSVDPRTVSLGRIQQGETTMAHIHQPSWMTKPACYKNCYEEICWGLDQLCFADHLKLCHHISTVIYTSEKKKKKKKQIKNELHDTPNRKWYSFWYYFLKIYFLYFAWLAIQNGEKYFYINSFQFQCISFVWMPQTVEIILEKNCPFTQKVDQDWSWCTFWRRKTKH